MYKEKKFTPSTLTLYKLTNIKPFEIRNKCENLQSLPAGLLQLILHLTTYYP